MGTEEESSDRHSSDDENDVDIEQIYQITPEQREYYTKQFRSVQIDPNGLVAGHIARIFFEKSRIPVEELRHIWQLCDVTRDGALSLGEFTAAMHLVVLRRNNIPLPSQLPQCLLNTVVPSTTTTTTTIQHNPPEADLLHLGDDRSTIKLQHPTSLIQQTSKSGSTSSSNSNNSRIQINSSPPIRDNSSIVVVTPPTVIAVGPSSITSTTNSTITTIPSTTKVIIEQQQPEWNQKNKDWSTNKPNWTKFPESPTSNVSSPGPKPVNFDMQRTAQAVVSDPQILHPVPLRVTPVGPEIIDDETSRNYRKSDNLVYDNGVVVINTSATTTLITRDVDSSPKQLSQLQHRDSLQNDIRPIQRPQPKKIPSKNFFPPPPQREPSFGSTNVTIINSTATTTVDVVENNIGGVILSSKKEPPPLPPPRFV